VINLLATGAGDTVSVQALANAPGEVGESLYIREFQFLTMLLDEEKPVAPPGHVAGNRADSFDRNLHPRSETVAGDILYRGRIPAAVAEGNDPPRRLQAMRPGSNPAQVRQRDRHAQGSMPAHPEIAHVVEEDYPRNAARIDRFT